METKKTNHKEQQILTVLDTSAFISYPGLISHVRGQVFVPLTVIKQLDGLKNNEDNVVSKRARHASFFIEKAIKEKKVAILTQFDQVDGLDNESDNRILGAVLRLKNNHPGAQVRLIATDRNIRIAANAFGISALNIRRNNVKKNYIWNLYWSVWFAVFTAFVVADVIFLGINIVNPVTLIILLFAGGSVLGFLYFIFTTLKRNHNTDPSFLAYSNEKHNDFDDYEGYNPSNVSGLGMLYRYNNFRTDRD